jgi:rubrerythrin
MSKSNYREYIKLRFAEMKEEPEYKDLKPQEKTQIIANEWKNKEEVTVLTNEIKEEVQITNQEPEKSSDTKPIDNESKYKYKCSCGYYFDDPIPTVCPKCGASLL